MLGLRFGAQTYGMVAMPPLGLLRVDGPHARAWAARYFTRGQRRALVERTARAERRRSRCPPGIGSIHPAGPRPNARSPPGARTRGSARCSATSVDCSIVARPEPTRPGSRCARSARSSPNASPTRPIRGFDAGARRRDLERRRSPTSRSRCRRSRTATTAIECILGSHRRFRRPRARSRRAHRGHLRHREVGHRRPTTPPRSRRCSPTTSSARGRPRTLDEFLGAVTVRDGRTGRGRVRRDARRDHRRHAVGCARSSIPDSRSSSEPAGSRSTARSTAAPERRAARTTTRASPSAPKASPTRTPTSC